MNKRKKVLIIAGAIVAVLVLMFFMITRNGLITSGKLNLLVLNVNQSSVDYYKDEVTQDEDIVWEYDKSELSEKTEDYSEVYVRFYLKNWTFLDNEVYAINVIPKEKTQAVRISPRHEGIIEKFTTNDVFAVIDLQVPYADDEKIIEEISKYDFELYVKNSLCNTRKYELNYDKEDIVIEKKDFRPEE